MSTYHINMTEKCNLGCKFCFAISSEKSMTKETLDSVINFIVNHNKQDHDKGVTVVFMGREIGLIDPKLVEYGINKLRSEIDEEIKIALNTNLVYELTQDHINMFKKIDEFGTSWDYKDIRFSNMKQRMIWYKNLHILQDLGLNIRCTCMLYKDLVKEVTPEMMIDFMLSMRINDWELNRLTKPIEYKEDYYNGKIKATNREVDEWMYKVFLLYEQVKEINPKFYVQSMECIRDSLHGSFYYDHCRTCQANNLTFGPTGNVSQCAFTQDKPFYNVLNKKLDYTVYDEVLEFEKKVPDECLTCKYYKYCKGDCCFNEWDETGCSTPKLIYEYLWNKEKIDE